MADLSFGLKIGLEGEREFKRAITDINREMRVLGSEMKLVASSFDKNDKSAESLTVRNQVLGKEIEAQKSKIETLRAALENSASSFGENDSRTKNWQIQLNNPSQAPYLWAWLGLLSWICQFNNPSQAPYLWATSTHPGTQ